MKKIVIFSIFSVLICLSTGENVNGPPPEPHTEVPVIPSTTERTTTQKPTPEPTTAPTTPSTTTTTTTTTTLPPPTTTPPATTVAPTTTTAPITTNKPTTKPTPKPKPEVGTWAVKNPDSNTTCLILKVALEIMVHYERTDKEIGNATIIVPNNASMLGYCANGNNDTQQITLMMGENNSNSITFNFEKNDTLKKFMLTSTEIQINPTEDVFPMMKSNATIKGKHDKEEFLTPLQMSYRCKPQKDYNLTTANNVFLGKVMISNLQVEAFHTSSGIKFDSAKDCEASETPGIVPIAVGCSLAALIIIVLVAYLVGRRRSQARGYLSM